MNETRQKMSIPCFLDDYGHSIDRYYISKTPTTRRLTTM